MPLQTSGAISLADIQAEFGGSNPIGINEYTRGGINVPDTPANSSIKTTTSSMSFADYYGASSAPAITVVLNSTYSETTSGVDVTSPYYSQADITINFENDGDLTVDRYSTPTTIGNGTFALTGWLSPAGQPTSVTDDYEIRATLSSGTTPSGTMNTWLNLGTTRSWTLSVSRTSSLGITSASCVVLFEIRPAGGGTVLDSTSITFSVSAENTL